MKTCAEGIIFDIFLFVVNKGDAHVAVDVHDGTDDVSLHAINVIPGIEKKKRKERQEKQEKKEKRKKGKKKKK
jgi:hypothetical protein